MIRLSLRDAFASSALRVYGAVLLAYPRALRDRYGDDMRRTFADRCAASPSSAAILLLLLRELADVAVTSVRRRKAIKRRLMRPTPSDRRDAMGSLLQDI